MNKVHARTKPRKLAAGKPAKTGTTPADRRLLAQAERETAEGKAAKAPAKAPRNEFQLTGPAFDGGESLREDCTAADLFSLFFSADGDGFLEQVLGCVADDFDLIEGAACGDMPCDRVIARVCQRNAWRIRVAVRVSELMQKARVTP